MQRSEQTPLTNTFRSTLPNTDLLNALVPVPKSGDEPFVGAGGELGFTLLDFWRWSASDLISNAMRGVLAEFLVARAMGVTSGVRTEWDAYDLLTEEGVKIEVKSSAYVQAWKQNRLSPPSFSVGAKCALDPVTNG